MFDPLFRKCYNRIVEQRKKAMPQTITLQLSDETLRRYQRGALAARKVLDQFLVERLADAAPP